MSPAPRAWPESPEVYGYLSLDERGQWLIRGEPISRTSLVEHLQRHYQCDDGGRWFVKNGWQQAFVTLAYLPWVLRVTGAGELINHCQRPVASIKGAAIDEYGALALLTDAGPGLVDSRDLEWALARLSAGDSPVADDDLDDALKVTSGALTELSFRAPCGTLLPVHRVDRDDMAAHFGFVPDPRPAPKAPQTLQ